MSTPTLLVILLVGGAVLLIAEMFAPGAVLGILGVLCWMAGTVLTFVHYGPQSGFVLLAVEIVLAMIGTMLGLRLLPKTRLGKAMTLEDDNASTTSPQEWTTLVGQEGEVTADCRPTGVAVIHGKRYSVVSENAFISEGQKVKVIAVEGTRIVVRSFSTSTPSTPSPQPTL